MLYLGHITETINVKKMFKDDNSVAKPLALLFQCPGRRCYMSTNILLLSPEKASEPF